MRITPLAAKYAARKTPNPGLAEFPNFVASLEVASRVSPDGRTLLVVTPGYNQNYDSGGNTIADASNEWVFVDDISQRRPDQLQLLQLSVSAFEGLERNPNALEFYVPGGPDDIIQCVPSAAA
jgi:hypothetical protein